MMKYLVASDEDILNKQEYDDFTLLSVKQFFLYGPLTALFGAKSLSGFLKRKTLTGEEFGLLKR